MSDTMPPVPDGVIAYLSVAGGEAALAFYEAAFDGRVTYKQMAPDGKRIMHARVAINGGLIMLSDDFPEYTGGVSQAPPADRPTGMVLHMAVVDCDAVFNQARSGGRVARHAAGGHVLGRPLRPCARPVRPYVVDRRANSPPVGWVSEALPITMVPMGSASLTHPTSLRAG